MEKLNFTFTPKKPTTDAKTRIDEIVKPYLKYLAWKNETVDKDATALYVNIYEYMECHTEAQLISILEWAKKKNTIHPLAIVKTLWRKPTK